MSNPYTAAQEAERAAREACDHDRPEYTHDAKRRCVCAACGGNWHDCTCVEYSAATDEASAACLAAAEACDAMAWVAREMEDECEGALLLRETAAAIAEDYAARATAWFRVAGQDQSIDKASVPL